MTRVRAIAWYSVTIFPLDIYAFINYSDYIYSSPSTPKIAPLGYYVLYSLLNICYVAAQTIYTLKIYMLLCKRTKLMKLVYQSLTVE